jgi:FtsP/CotA-like multicopper oxidase with cupredoxin domain
MRSNMICRRGFLAGFMALTLASAGWTEPADVSTETSSNLRYPFQGVLRFMAPQSRSEPNSARRGIAAIQNASPHRGTIHASRGGTVRARYSYRVHDTTRLSSSAHWRFDHGDAALRSFYPPYWYPRPAYSVSGYPNIAYPSPGYIYYYRYPFGYPYRFRYYYPGY